MTDFRDRMKEAADTIGGLNRLAEIIGIPRRTLGDQLAGKTEPKMSLVVSAAEATGYSITWLASGIGPKLADAPVGSANVNAELMERLHDKVASIFHDVDQKPPQRRIAREAANLYNELAKVVQDMSDQEMVDAALPMVALEFKRRLERAAEEPGTGKRSAS
jgi:hypothetical protein